MKKKAFSTLIDAQPQKVWEVLWDDKTYPLWTAPFSEGSHAQTDWKEGSRVHFLDGKGMGMVSEIVTSRPPSYMSFRHLGFVKDGVEKFDGPEVSQWAGSMENYTLTGLEGKTELAVDLDIAESHESYFDTAWPKALERLKELAEGKG